MIDLAVIEKNAMELREADRALLADRLLESISKPSIQLREMWIKECDSRAEALKRGDIQLVDGASAMNELRQKFSR